MPPGQPLRSVERLPQLKGVMRLAEEQAGAAAALAGCALAGTLFGRALHLLQIENCHVVSPPFHGCENRLGTSLSGARRREERKFDWLVVQRGAHREQHASSAGRQVH